MDPSRALRPLVVALLLAGLAGVASSQSEPGSAGGSAEEPIPALVAVGLDGGFPSYRTMTARASLQARFVGAAVRAGFGPGAGPYLGLTLRGYPPLPGLPVPIWLGAGLGATAAGATPFAAVGVHVPVAQRWRLDLEGGVAWPELLDERTWAPHLSVGVSYAFPVDLDPSARRTAPVAGGPARGSSAACEAGPPDEALLDGAVDAAARAFVADARATYGSLYDDLRYSLNVRDRRVSGTSATVRVAYEGSVREIATGNRTSASGVATAEFEWTGCSWRRTGLTY